jgi:hypothetical protein
MEGTCSTHEGVRKRYSISAGHPEGRRPREILRHRRQDDINTYVTGRIRTGFIWRYLKNSGRLLREITGYSVSTKAVNLWTSYETNISRKTLRYRVT